MSGEKSDPKSSAPDALRQRMHAAYESGKPMHVEPDEVTGVLDIALGQMRETADKGIERVRELVRRLDSSSPPPPPKTV